MAIATQTACAPTRMVRIADIVETTDDGVRVRFVTGAEAWLPRRYVAFYPGHVELPLWLMRKVGPNVTARHRSGSSGP